MNSQIPFTFSTPHKNLDTCHIPSQFSLFHGEFYFLFFIVVAVCLLIPKTLTDLWSFPFSILYFALNRYYANQLWMAVIQHGHAELFTETSESWGLGRQEWLTRHSGALPIPQESEQLSEPGLSEMLLSSKETCLQRPTGRRETGLWKAN